MMIYTPQSIEKALVTIAEEMAIQYDAELKLTDPTAKTQRKALTIEREIAKLKEDWHRLSAESKTPIRRIVKDERKRKATNTRRD